MTDLGVADDAGGGASRRHIEEVHGLAGQELAQAWSEDLASVRGPWVRRSAGPFQLQLPSLALLVHNLAQIATASFMSQMKISFLCFFHSQKRRIFSFDVNRQKSRKILNGICSNI